MYFRKSFISAALLLTGAGAFSAQPPSSMIAKDLSHDRYVLDNKYIIDDPNIEYIDVSYDLYEGKGDKKKKVGIKTCKFANIKDENGNPKRGVIAEILMMLLKENGKYVFYCNLSVL